MGARPRAAVLRRAGPFSRPSNRVRDARWTVGSRRRGGHDAPLSRRPRRGCRALGVLVVSRRQRAPRRRRWRPWRRSVGCRPRRRNVGLTNAPLVVRPAALSGACMTAEDRVKAIAELGFTPRQARFLVFVL